jgi:hypothetical protein
MSLLTNDQIMELIKLAINKSPHLTLFDLFYDWNERQTATQFEPDWDKTSSNATRVYLDAVWFNSEMKEIDRTAICSFDRPATPHPHPHAEMIMKYAEVAARRIDPWVEFEWGVDGAHWCSCDRWIYFKTDNCYRHIGETK